MDNKEREEELVKRAKEVASELWALTLEGIADGELKAPGTLEDAFKAGVVSVMALVDIELDKISAACLN